MESIAEIAMLECMHKMALEQISLWKSLQNAEDFAHKRTRERVWEIMGRGIQRQNNFGDTTEVTLDINDWRELCEAVNFGV